MSIADSVQADSPYADYKTSPTRLVRPTPGIHDSSLTLSQTYIHEDLSGEGEADKAAAQQRIRRKRAAIFWVCGFFC
jgi:hypothetical protein